MTEEEKKIVDDVVEDTDADTEDVINAIDEEKAGDEKVIDMIKRLDAKIDGFGDKLNELSRYMYEGFRDNTNQNYKIETEDRDLFEEIGR